MNERLSQQAKLVLGVLSSECCHLTAEEILGRLNGIGGATVYRALDRLTELGLVRRLSLDSRTAVYEYVRKDHVHLVCTRCGRVHDVPADFSGMVAEAVKVGGHHVDRSDVTAYGVCKDCLAREAEGFHITNTTNIQ